MSSRPPFPEPANDASPTWVSQRDEDAQYYRQILHEVIEIGADLARALHRQATPESNSAPSAEPGAAPEPAPAGAPSPTPPSPSTASPAPSAAPSRLPARSARLTRPVLQQGGVDQVGATP